MAFPNSRTAFKDNCLRRLGAPVIEINVSDEQVDDRIDEALTDFFRSCKYNKYSKWYFLIILNAIERDHTSLSNKEAHHYIPKSFGGTDTVFLTSKEHFLCHLLLARMFEGTKKSKMCWAIMQMKGKRRYFNSLLYEASKKNLKHTEETKQKLKEKRKGTQQGEKNYNYGNRGINNPLFNRPQTENHRNNISISLTGRKRSVEEKQNISFGKKNKHVGKRWFNNGIEEKHGYPTELPAGWNFGRLNKNRNSNGRFV